MTKNLLLNGTNVLVEVDGVWLPAVVKYPMSVDKGHMLKTYPGYPGAAEATYHCSKSVNWRRPETSVSEFINKFFLDFPSRGLI